MKKLIVLLLFTIFHLHAFAENVNIYNFFSLNLPNEYQIYSIQNALVYNDENQQYWLDIDINCIYKNLYFTINISFFGNQPRVQ